MKNFKKFCKSFKNILVEPRKNSGKILNILWEDFI